MPASTSKRVIALRFEGRAPVQGFWSGPDSGIEVLTEAGAVLAFGEHDLKMICFVREWPAGASLSRKSFLTRPKGSGLWVRFRFRDGDALEALLGSRLLEWDARGYLGAPPDSLGNVQRIWVPKSALTDCELLGVVGAAKRPKQESGATGQIRMFD